MNTIQRIVKNTIVLGIAQVTSSLLGFLFIMYTARYLGAEGFGILSFALAFTGIFGVFPDLGLGQLTVREVARDKSLASKYLGNIAVIKVILTIITFGLICLTINLLEYPNQTINVVYLVAVYIIFNAFSQMFYSIFQAHEKMEYVSIGQILNSVLMLSGALFVIYQGFGVIGFASLYVLVSAIILGYSFVVSVLKFAKPKIEIDFDFWKPTIKEALPFGLTGIFVTIYYYIDTVMLSLMVPNSNEVIGWYNAAYKLVLALLFMRGILHISLFPNMSEFYKTSKESLKLICERLFKYSLIISFPIAVGTAILSERFILLFYGSEYFPSVIALQILIWSNVIIFANFTPRLFEAINKQIIVTKITMLGAIVNVILNLLLIPQFSYVGAAIATCLTEFILLFPSFIIFSKTEYRFSGSFAFKNVLKIFIAGVCMGCFVKYFYDENLMILIIILALLYVALLCIMKTFDETDIDIIRNLIKGKVNIVDKVFERRNRK